MAGKLREKFGRMLGKNKSTTEVVKREEKENSREAVVNELRRGYGELVETMQSVRTHMEEQSRRSDRIMEVIETLPEVMQAIPESTERQNKALAGLAETLETQNRSTAELTGALTGLADATRRQEQSLSGMHERLNGTLAEGEASRRAMAEGVEKMAVAVSGVTQDQQAGREVLAGVADQSRRQQKQMVAMTGVSWALAVVALCVAGYVAVVVTRAAQTPVVGRELPATAKEDAARLLPADGPTVDGDATPGKTPTEADTQSVGEGGGEPVDETAVEGAGVEGTADVVAEPVGVGGLSLRWPVLP